MKLIITLVALLNTTASFASGFVCKEIANRNDESQQLPKGAPRLSMIIEQLSELDSSKPLPSGKLWDHLYKVNVQVIETSGRVNRVLKKFATIAQVEDVMYQINAVRSNGVQAIVFLDEPNESWVKLTDSSGTKREANLNCREMNVPKI